MSFEGQLVNPDYHKADKGTQFNDISRLLEMAESVGPEFSSQTDELKSKIAFILDTSRNERGALYREILSAKDRALAQTAQERGLDMSNFSNNFEFTRLMQVFQVLGSAHVHTYITHFLRLINIAVGNALAETGREMPSFLIADEVKNIKDDDSNFDEIVTKVKDAYGNTGLFFFFGRCIKEGKGFCELPGGGTPKIISHLDGLIAHIRENNASRLGFGNIAHIRDENDFQFWNFRNLRNYAITKRMMDRQNNPEGYVLSLSGGVSNGISQIGLVRRLIEEGKTIRLITGYSIGAIIGTLLSLCITGNRERDLVAIGELEAKMTSSLQDTQGLYGPRGQVYRLSGNVAGSQEARDQVSVFFSLLGASYGIDENTTFADPRLNIPVLVGATRKYGNITDRVIGEQEMVLGGDDLVMNAVRCSSNLQGKFGRYSVDGYEAEDYAENESGLMLPFTLLGVPYNRQIVADVGYSSNTYNNMSTWLSRFIRGNYSLWRDMIGKQMIAQNGGLVYNIDSTTSNNSGGFDFSATITRTLLNIGYNTQAGNEHRYNQHPIEFLSGWLEGSISPIRHLIRLGGNGISAIIRV